ncbi:MAG TPA: DNA replication/repair protein RecF [Fimbriimonadaceae bacterium]|nr:DNA replication/repair protein RecF [Fimbriimonadaceae bacterium]
MITSDPEEKAREKLGVGVESVRLSAFRNYTALDVELDPAFNVIAGANAQGKTNFLESLYLLSTTRLLRGQRDAEAILQGHGQCTVTAELYGGRTQLGMILEAGIKKRALLNGIRLPRASDLIGRLPCVCISSLDLAIVRDEPTDRRLFLDLELCALYPSYLRNLAQYKRALEQRNALLRESREFMQPAVLFESWEEQIASAGAELRKARAAYVVELAPIARERHRAMGDGEQLDIGYLAKDEAKTDDELREALQATRSQDVSRGGTSVGPHRDDLSIVIDGREGRLYGSQGQQRTSMIALKLATLEVGKQKLGFPPLLLLDDILSDLDQRRRSLLVELVLREAGQAVLTCTEAAAAGPDILDRARVFEVRAGAMRPTVEG